MSDREQLLTELQPTSFAIAYRMLGSVTAPSRSTGGRHQRQHYAVTHET